MACVAEKRIFNEEKIRDTALMAIDATAKIEDDDLGLMNAHIAKTQQHSSAICQGRKWLAISRGWWDARSNELRLSEAASCSAKAHQKKSSTKIVELFEGLCYASCARHFYSAAEPQEDFISKLYDSIRVYQNIFKQVAFEAVAIDAGLSPGYRYPLKTCPPPLHQ